jgi:hypothetical protein
MELMQEKGFFTKRIFSLLFISILAWSCGSEKKKIVHYNLDHVSISRYDEDKKTYLYVGYCNNSESIKAHVSVVIDWQFDDFLMASMIFHKDRTVELMSGGGGELKKISPGNAFFFRDYKPREYAEIIDEFSGTKGDKNLCELSDNLDLEKAKNLENRSYVKISEHSATEVKCNN